MNEKVNSYLGVSMFFILSSPLSRLPNTPLLFLEGVKGPPGLTKYACVNKDFATISRKSYLLGVAKYSDCPPPLFLGV